MTVHSAPEPTCKECERTPEIETIIESRPRDLGGFGVRRVLPSLRRRTVGPYIFFDHMGPATLAAGHGIDVRPHPHINLATVTYLFDGEIIHRDSLGVVQPIRPGAVNWMTAGSGIVHSERSSEDRALPRPIHGIQLWLGLPSEHEETAPQFDHHPADSLPQVERDGVVLRVLAGTAYGETSPVQTLSPLFYVDAAMQSGAELEVPTAYPERAAYVVEGAVLCGAEDIEAPRMVVFGPHGQPRLRARTNARVMLLGGAPLDGARHMWWNFASSRPERVEQAKRDWQAGRFPQVPDDDEFIPLPE